MPRDLDLDLDLGWDEGHIIMRNTCRTTSMLNHVTLASRTTEIWLFECCEISTVGEVWTLVIAFVEGNSNIGLRWAVVQVIINHEFWAPGQKGGGDRPRKVQFCKFWRSVTLTLTVDGVEVTLVRICGGGLPTHHIRSKSEKRFRGRTDGRTDTPEFQSTRSSVGDDLIKMK